MVTVCHAGSGRSTASFASVAMHYAVSELLLLIIRGFVGLFPFASKLSAYGRPKPARVNTCWPVELSTRATNWRAKSGCAEFLSTAMG